jgi:hypothetical protein
MMPTETPTKKPSQNLLFLLILIYLVIPIGVEPITPALEGQCSIQLSYGTMCH